jgi:exosortase
MGLALASRHVMLIVIPVVVLAWAPTLRDLAAIWATSRYASHGFCVAAFAVYAAWDRRSELPRPVWRPGPRGRLVLVLAATLLGAGYATGSLTLRALSLPVAGLALAELTLGAGGARTLRFPLAFFLLAVPLPAATLAWLSRLTQSLAAVAAEDVLVLLRIPVVRDGLTLSIGSIDLQVTEACNGLPFLLASVVVGVAAAWALQTGTRHRLTILALAVLGGIVANPVRLAGTAVLASIEPAAVVGTPHWLFGKLVYLAVAATVAAAATGLLRCSGRPWRIRVAGQAHRGDA